MNIIDTSKLIYFTNTIKGVDTREIEHNEQVDKIERLIQTVDNYTREIWSQHQKLESIKKLTMNPSNKEQDVFFWKVKEILGDKE